MPLPDIVREWLERTAMPAGPGRIGLGVPGPLSADFGRQQLGISPPQAPQAPQQDIIQEYLRSLAQGQFGGDDLGLATGLPPEQQEGLGGRMIGGLPVPEGPPVDAGLVPFERPPEWGEFSQQPPPSPSAGPTVGPFPPSPDLGQQDYPGSLPMRFPGAPEAPPPFPDAPLPPPGGPPADGGLVPPEAPGDLARARAGGELERLQAMRDIGEGFGRVQVVTPGDIIHRTQKGMMGRLPYEAEGTRADIEALQDLELERLKQFPGPAVGGLTEDQQKQMITERGQWRSNVRVRKMGEAVDAAEGLLTMINQKGSIAHQMAARMLLAASGEERYSEQDIKGVLRRAGVAQATMDAITRFTVGDMTEGLRTAYRKVATEMARTKREQMQTLAEESADGFSRLSGVPTERVIREAYNLVPSGPADEKIHVIEEESGESGEMTRAQYERSVETAQRKGTPPPYRMLGTSPKVRGP